MVAHPLFLSPQCLADAARATGAATAPMALRLFCDSSGTSTGNSKSKGGNMRWADVTDFNERVYKAFNEAVEEEHILEQRRRQGHQDNSADNRR